MTKKAKCILMKVKSRANRLLVIVGMVLFTLSPLDPSFIDGQMGPTFWISYFLLLILCVVRSE